jgi:5-methylcytosine-specific restriction endonuclease McrA
MTTDHVVPRTLGGEDSWENLVCACVRCNNGKGNRTPEQARMKLLRQPRRPDYFSFVYCHTSLPNQKWRPYLFLG